VVRNRRDRVLVYCTPRPRQHAQNVQPCDQPRQISQNKLVSSQIHTYLTPVICDRRADPFRIIAKQIIRRSTDTPPVLWRTESARRFFETRFGDHPFVFPFNPGADGIRVGRAATRYPLGKENLPQPLFGRAEQECGTTGESFDRIVYRQAPDDIGRYVIITDEVWYHPRLL